MDKILIRCATTFKSKDYGVTCCKTKDNKECLIINSKKESSIFCIMVVDDKLEKVAFLDYSIEANKKTLFVNKLEVLPDFQFVGIGTMLLNSAGNICNKLNFKKLKLISLTTSLGFYQKLGFDVYELAKDAIYICEYPIKKEEINQILI